MKGGGLDNRSAGACPPRALDYADDGEGQALALREEAAFFYGRNDGKPSTILHVSKLTVITEPMSATI